VPVPERDLPVILPEGEIDFTPRGTSPLGACPEFMDTTCPTCGFPAKRDPDTMDTFVDSSWYFLRYPSTGHQDVPFDPTITKKWLPVDVYVGGPEHATGHLIYARYITKFLHSIGRLEFDEPFKRLIHQGIITNAGQRMSKSKGNVINPDAFVDEYGSDCFRLFLMFMGDYVVGGDWSDEGIRGVRRFQNRIWRLFEQWAEKVNSVTTKSEKILDSDLNRVLHYTIKEVSTDLESFRFNTAISRQMELINALYSYTADPTKVNLPFLREVMEKLAVLFAPFAPHMAEELWTMLGHTDGVFNQKWVEYNPENLQRELVTVVVQIRGKIIEKLEVKKDSSESDLLSIAMNSERVQRAIGGSKVVKVVCVPNRLLNLVLA